MESIIFRPRVMSKFKKFRLMVDDLYDKLEAEKECEKDIIEEKNYIVELLLWEHTILAKKIVDEMCLERQAIWEVKNDILGELEVSHIRKRREISTGVLTSYSIATIVGEFIVGDMKNIPPWYWDCNSGDAEFTPPTIDQLKALYSFTIAIRTDGKNWDFLNKVSSLITHSLGSSMDRDEDCLEVRSATSRFILGEYCRLHSHRIPAWKQPVKRKLFYPLSTSEEVFWEDFDEGSVPPDFKDKYSLKWYEEYKKSPLFVEGGSADREKELTKGDEVLSPILTDDLISYAVEEVKKHQPSHRELEIRKLKDLSWLSRITQQRLSKE